jgi:hypothetical protein
VRCHRRRQVCLSPLIVLGGKGLWLGQLWALPVCGPRFLGEVRHFLLLRLLVRIADGLPNGRRDVIPHLLNLSRRQLDIGPPPLLNRIYLPTISLQSQLYNLPYFHFNRPITNLFSLPHLLPLRPAVRMTRFVEGHRDTGTGLVCSNVNPDRPLAISGLFCSCNHLLRLLKIWPRARESK